MTYDDDLPIPPTTPQAPEMLKSICINGPWAGATITHEMHDHKPRYVEGGEYWFIDPVWSWVTPLGEKP